MEKSSLLARAAAVVGQQIDVVAELLAISVAQAVLVDQVIDEAALLGGLAR